MLKVLNISTDASLLDRAGGSLNDSQQRHRLYGDRVRQLDIIVLWRQGAGRERVEVAENVRVIPAVSPFKSGAVFSAIRLGKRLHRETAYDCITAQNPFDCGFVGWVLRRTCGLPLNIQVHAEFFDNPHWVRGSVKRRGLHYFGKKLLRSADTVRVGTSRQKKRYVSNMGFPEGDVFFLPVIVSADHFRRESPEGLKEKLFQSGDRKILLHVGRLERQKNLSMLLDVAQKLKAGRKDLLFALVGDGPDRESLEKEIAKRNLGDTVRLFGFISREKVVDYFLGCDLLVLTSLFEGTCRVLVEAAFAGKPVVTTSVAGADDVVVDGSTGYVVPVDDREAFSEKILQLLASEKTMQSMGQAAREHMTRFFDEKKFLDGLLTMWKATAGKKIS